MEEEKKYLKITYVLEVEDWVDHVNVARCLEKAGLKEIGKGIYLSIKNCTEETMYEEMLR